ncbi:MAG: hypothetical protein VW547_01995 [Alphaproteobacteria bacterium]
MKALALALLIACGSLGDGAVQSGGASSGSLSGGGFGAPPSGNRRQYFKLDPSTNGSGPTLLSDTLPDSGSGLSLVLSCVASQESGASWACTGGTLTETGTVSQTTVTPWVDGSKALDFNATSDYFGAASTSLADLTTEDFVVEVVARLGDNANDSIACKMNATDTVGWRITSGATGIVTFKSGAAGGTSSPTVTITSSQNTLSHVIAFNKRNTLSGTRVCANGTCGTAAHTTSYATSSMTTATDINVGACSDLSHAGDAQVYAFRMWKGSGLDTADYANIAMERSLRVEGLYPTVSAGSALATIKTRATPATVDVIDGSDVRRMFRVGANFMRVGKRKEVAGGEYLTGYFADTAVTNKMLQSADFATTWTTSAAAVSTNTTEDPFVDDDTNAGDSIIGDGTTASHYVTQSVVLTAAAHTLSVFAKAGAGAGNQAVLIYEAVGGKGACFKLSDCSFVANYNGTAPSDTAVEDWGNGWCRVAMTWTATAASTEMRVYASDDADSCGATDQEYTGDAATADVILWGAQVETGTQQGFPSSYVPTTTASATKNTDQFQFSGTDNVPSNGTNTQRWTFLGPEQTISGSTQYPATLETDSTHYMACRMTGSSSPPGNLFYGVVNGTDVLGLATSPTGYHSPNTDVQDGEIHDGACSWGTDTFYKYVDGVQNDNGTPTGTPPSITKISIGWIQSLAAGWPGGLVGSFEILSGDDP